MRSHEHGNEQIRLSHITTHVFSTTRWISADVRFYLFLKTFRREIETQRWRIRKPASGKRRILFYTRYIPNTAMITRRWKALPKSCGEFCFLYVSRIFTARPIVKQNAKWWVYTWHDRPRFGEETTRWPPIFNVIVININTSYTF
jgi:hypothetical protein